MLFRSPLKDKTLEVWARLDGLDQRGGGLMSVQTLDGARFDAIVFGEREPRRWTAGSDLFRRTQDVGGDVERSSKDETVHLAVVYADRIVSIYRNGKPYGRPYTIDASESFPPGGAQVVFGVRHLPVGQGRMFAGAIDRAQLYDRALTADEIARSSGDRKSTRLNSSHSSVSRMPSSA